MSSKNPIIRRGKKQGVQVQRVSPEDVPVQLRPGGSEQGQPQQIDMHTLQQMMTVAAQQAQQAQQQQQASQGQGQQPQVVIINAPQASAPPVDNRPIQVTTEVHADLKPRQRRQYSEPRTSFLGLLGFLAGMGALMLYHQGYPTFALLLAAGGLASGFLGAASSALGANTKMGVSVLGLALSGVAFWLAWGAPVGEPTAPTPSNTGDNSWNQKDGDHHKRQVNQPGPIINVPGLRDPGGGAVDRAKRGMGGNPLPNPQQIPHAVDGERNNAGADAGPTPQPARAIPTAQQFRLNDAMAELETAKATVLADPAVNQRYLKLLNKRNEMERELQDARAKHGRGEPPLVRANLRFQRSHSAMVTERDIVWERDPRVRAAKREVETARRALDIVGP